MTAVEFLQAKAQRTEAALARHVDAWEGVADGEDVFGDAMRVPA